MRKTLLLERQKWRLTLLQFYVSIIVLVLILDNYIHAISCYFVQYLL